MNLTELLDKGLVERFDSSKDQIDNSIEIATSDLDSAKKMLEIKLWNWAHNAAYNAMLQAGRGFDVLEGIQTKEYGTPSRDNIFLGSSLFEKVASGESAGIRQSKKEKE